MSEEILQPNPNAVAIVFPCFIVQSSNGQGFVFQDIEDGDKAVCILTDEDLLERYLSDIGLIGRRASRFDRAVDLLENLENIPPAITHVIVDPPKLKGTKTVCPIRIESFKNCLAWKLRDQLEPEGEP
jgi:hypothetical protein